MLALTLTPRFSPAQSGSQDSVGLLRIQQVLSAWNDTDLALVDSAFVDSGIYEDVAAGTTNIGKPAIKEGIRSTFLAIPDFHVALHGSLASDTLAALDWVMTGTQTGDMGPVLAQGQHFSVRGASIARLRNGKITRWTDYYDLYDFLRQLGALPDSLSTE